MNIAVDFDGTIVTHEYPNIGKELPFAVETLRQLQRDGHKIILWSVREGQLLEEAIEWCRARGLEFYASNKDYPENSFQCLGKVKGWYKISIKGKVGYIRQDLVEWAAYYAD